MYIWVGWQWKAKTRQCFEETRGTRHQLLSVALSLFIGQYCSFIAFYLDVKVFRVKDNSTPETHLKKYLTLLLSLLNTKGRKSGFRPHGAIIHWSGIFEPPERSPGVLGRITQDNVFKSKVQQSSGNKSQFLEHYSTVETVQSKQKWGAPAGAGEGQTENEALCHRQRTSDRECRWLGWWYRVRMIRMMLRIISLLFFRQKICFQNSGWYFGESVSQWVGAVSSDNPVAVGN